MNGEGSRGGSRRSTEEQHRVEPESNGRVEDRRRERESRDKRKVSAVKDEGEGLVDVMSFPPSRPSRSIKPSSRPRPINLLSNAAGRILDAKQGLEETLIDSSGRAPTSYQISVPFLWSSPARPPLRQR